MATLDGCPFTRLHPPLATLPLVEHALVAFEYIELNDLSRAGPSGHDRTELSFPIPKAAHLVAN